MPCERCGQPLPKRPPSARQRFCSLSCAARRPRPEKRNRVTRPCGYCGEPVTAPASYNRRYCSRRCKGLAQRVSKAEQDRRRRARKYGLTIEDLAAMEAAAGGKCACCGRASDKLVVDHDHDTGKVRDLLCHRCNLAVGALESADAGDYMAYLLQHGKHMTALKSEHGEGGDELLIVGKK